MTDKPIYISAAAGAEAVVISVHLVFDESEGVFDADVGRYPIVGWHIDLSEEPGGSAIPDPVLFGRARMPGDMLCIVLSDGSLVDKEGDHFPTLDDAKDAAEKRARVNWEMKRDKAKASSD